MNTSVLKTVAFWVSALSTIVALLVAKGVILSGSTPDQVIAWVVALAGQLFGHSMAAPAPAAPTATPPAGN